METAIEAIRGRTYWNTEVNAMENLKGTQKIIFTLAECEQCGTRYAVAPDPYFPGQWIVFERDRSIEQPTHVCVGGLLCLQGHTLDVTAKDAALTNEGQWLNLTVDHTEPVLN